MLHCRLEKKSRDKTNEFDNSNPASETVRNSLAACTCWTAVTDYTLAQGGRTAVTDYPPEESVLMMLHRTQNTRK